MTLARDLRELEDFLSQLAIDPSDGNWQTGPNADAFVELRTERSIAEASVALLSERLAVANARLSAPMPLRLSEKASRRVSTCLVLIASGQKSMGKLQRLIDERMEVDRVIEETGDAETLEQTGGVYGNMLRAMEGARSGILAKVTEAREAVKEVESELNPWET